MQYGTGELGTFIVIEEKDDRLYTLFFNAVIGNGGKSTELNKFFEFLIVSRLVDIKKGAVIQVVQIFKEGNYKPDFVVFHFNSEMLGGIEVSEAVKVFMQNINQSMVKSLDANVVYNMFQMYLESFTDNLLKVDTIEHSGAKDIRENGEAFVEEINRKKNSLSERQIYEIKFRDMFVLKDYADYFFVQSGKCYIKTLPGILLDDFYKRADIVETSKKIIKADQLAAIT